MEQDLKRALLTEFRAVVSRIIEAQRDLKDLNPRQEALAKLLEAYGWLSDVEKLEPDDDLKNNPDATKSKGQKIAAKAPELTDSGRARDFVRAAHEKAGVTPDLKRVYDSYLANQQRRERETGAPSAP